MKQATTKLRISLCLIIFFLVVFFVDKVFNKYILTILKVPPVSPSYSFADLRLIAQASDCVRLNKDPYFDVSCDKWGRLFNYPRVWLFLGKLGVTEKHVFVIGVLLGVGFYLSAIMTIPEKEKGGIFYLLFLLSPVCLLAVDRGNNDLVVFILVAMILSVDLFKKTVCFYCVILLASLAKLYPFLLVLLSIKEHPKLCKLLTLTITTIFLAYLFLTIDDVILIFRNTLHGIDHSYGFLLLGETLNDLFHFREQKDHQILSIIILVSINLAIFFLCALNKIKNKYSEGVFMAGFRASALIFIGTFCLGGNWDYRLIFLYFSLPQILEWSKEEEKYLTQFMLFSIVLVLWSPLIFQGTVGRIVKGFFLWGLYCGYFSIFILTLPKWVKKHIFIKY